MAIKQKLLGSAVLVVLSCSTAGMAQGWDDGYSDEPSFAGQHGDGPTLHWRIRSDDPTPRVYIDNSKRRDSTGNLILDNDMQQDSERCMRIRSRMKDRDAAKLNC